MKRALGLIFFIVVCILGFLTIKSWIFLIAALSLLAIFLYSNELSGSGDKLHRGIFAPVIKEEKRTNWVLIHKIEATEQRMSSMEQTLEKLASAIELYAQHLASHTSAIQGLSEASHELKRSAAEQNKVITYLLNNLEHPPEKPAPKVEKTAPVAAEPLHEIVTKQFPPGCVRGRRTIISEETPAKLSKPWYQV